ncbi:hypothetical protein [Spirosoma aerophilum]
MKTPFAPGLLIRSLLLASLGSLVSCSSVLQANRLSRSFPQQPAEMVADVSSEPVSPMGEAQQLGAEAPFGFPRSMPSGYRWTFIVKKGNQNTPSLGNWVVTPNQ